jgi:hypothetical protein
MAAPAVVPARDPVFSSLRLLTYPTSSMAGSKCGGHGFAAMTVNCLPNQFRGKKARK